MQLAAKQAQADTLLSQVEASETAAQADQLAGDGESANVLELKLAAAEEDVSQVRIVQGLPTTCIRQDVCRKT